GIPRSYVALSFGVLVLGYVGVKQQVVRPSRPALGRHDLESPVLKTAVGFVSGTVLGVSNIGVQTVLYLDSLELDRGTFIGVLSMYFVGISAMRMGAAWFLGFYSGDLLVLSAAASFVGLAGVGFGKLLRSSDLLPEGVCRLSFLWLLTLIGIRLVYAGATAVV
ncbi:MAG: sulfite exporter TauE/SafE family protein, partial [Halobacteria archaeon]|nr:sulfite exporter TauE/SafE family protein [Halobacteria archaeon]